jgi:hypothetical protein
VLASRAPLKRRQDHPAGVLVWQVLRLVATLGSGTGHAIISFYCPDYRPQPRAA